MVVLLLMRHGAGLPIVTTKPTLKKVSMTISAMLIMFTVAALKCNNYNIEKHHEVMKDVVWSRAVQYGAGNIGEMFAEACEKLGYPNLSYVDDSSFDADMIKAIYLKVCSTTAWTNGSPALRKGLYIRFERECAEALERI